MKNPTIFEMFDRPNVTLKCVCPVCDEVHEITVNAREYEKGIDQYKLNGVSIQKAFPNFTPSQREFIMTGVCPSCRRHMK